MGSFYGNIAHSNKTAIAFDKIYETRYLMDQQGGSDGVFVGRYVLVEYDDPGIQGYYWSGNNGPAAGLNIWTTTPNPQLDGTGLPVQSTRLPILRDVCYWDLFSNQGFILSGTNTQFVAISTYGDNTPYQTRYRKDLATYGRGYDSTVWLKTFNSTSNTYKYVMIAEMNTVVPNFHLVADPPAAAPLPPYFDSNLNNLDYYLHVQNQMTFKVSTNRSRDTASKSDESISYTNIIYQDGSTSSSPTYTATKVTGAPASIYYNKAGFDPATRSYHTIPSGKENSINYSFETSGRKYGSTPIKAGSTAEDIMAWYIYLPAIGNTICTVWDKLYSTNRKQALLTETARTGTATTTNTITLNTTTNTHILASNATDGSDSAFGIFNTMREYLGQVIPVNGAQNAAGGYNYSLNTIRYLDSGTSRTYYYPQYESTFTAFSGTPASGTVYYWKDGNVYKVANTAALPSGTQLYTRTTTNTSGTLLRWYAGYTGTSNANSGLAALDADSKYDGIPNTVYGAIAYINKLLGTKLSEANSRDDRTVIGLMNRMTDLIANIDKTLVPNKFVVTAANGQITTGKPKLVLSTQSTAVTGITGNTSASTMTIDNPINTGLTITTKNKWIQMLISGQTIQIAHMLTAATNPNTEIKTTAGAHWTDNTAANSKITIPTFTYDETGHIISTGTTSFYLPYNFKTFSLSAQSTAVTELTVNTTDVVADNAIDTFTFATGNKWIRMANDATNDKLTIAHALSPLTGATANTEIKASATGWGTATTNTDNILTIPTFTFDEAGHLTAKSTVSFYLPHSFKTFAISAQSAAVTNSTANTTSVVADNSADTFTFATANKWLTIAGDATNDKITFGHIISGVTAGNYGLSDNETVASLDVDNQFEVPYFSVDEAGHITNAVTHTITIPESFAKVTIGAHDDTIVTEMTTNTNSIEADSINDGFVLQSGNRWIRLAATPNSDLIQIAHVVRAIPTSSTSTTFNGETGTFADDFGYDVLTYDEAGHITKKDHYGYKLPYGYKTIAVNNVNDIDTISTANNNCIASSVIDTINLVAGNKWLVFNANPTTKTITLGHKKITSSFVGSYGDSSAQTPAFGNTFKVPTLTIDEAGHITEISEHTVTIPVGALTNTDSGNVLTEISYNNTTNSTTVNKAYVGTLALTNYAIADAVSEIAATDTINSAFGKVQFALNTLTTNLSNESDARANNDTLLSQIINGDPENDEDNGLIGRINALENANTSEEQRITNTEDRISNLEDIINDVEEEDENNPGQTIITSYGLISRTSTLESANVNNDTRITALENIINDTEEENLEDPSSPIVVPGLENRVSTLESINVQALIDAAVNDILNNYEMSLKAPNLTISNTDGILNISVNNITEADNLTYQWQFRTNDSADWEDIVDATANEYDTTIAQNAGDYHCVVVRTRNTMTSTATSSFVTIVNE